ncbi:uncharacterized protein RCO7_14794 [Rhynchosporium graminicola]|uniref:Uncharacterized protein n=1 Tax=Rhynchosporium graminicola TaxID=2792576 RepID=A0A1E1L2U4_9HELO|nr:uncharacterized protein RCO7_14794 [Rhynchosporium commune]
MRNRYGCGVVAYDDVSQQRTYSSPIAAEDFQEIRDDIECVLAEHGGKWDKAAVAKLIKTDSAVRESLGISQFACHGGERVVVDPKGITMENGLHLP